MSDEGKYRQLAIFSVIIAEVVITPLALGGGLAFLFKNHPSRTAISAFGALVGLCVAFYRISRLVKRGGSGESNGK